MNTQYFKELHIEPIKQSVVILDIDGTLLADGERTPTIDPAAAANVQQLVAQGNQVYLCSNGFSHKLERNRTIAKQLQIPFYETSSKKPLASAILPLIAGTTKPVIVIGDKFLTDGLLAINLGIPYIDVRSIRSPQDPPHARLVYLADRIIKNFFALETVPLDHSNTFDPNHLRAYLRNQQQKQ